MRMAQPVGDISSAVKAASSLMDQTMSGGKKRRHSKSRRSKSKRTKSKRSMKKSASRKTKRRSKTHKKRR